MKTSKKNSRNLGTRRNSPEAVAKRYTQGVRHGRHCVFMLHAHLVFVTKYRRRVFTKRVLEEMQTIFQDVCVDFESELKEFNGENDHVHLLVNYPPKVSLSKLVNSLKGVSARRLRQQNHRSIR